MDISSYILAGFDYLPKITATVDGTDMPVLFNQMSLNDSKELGGFVNDADFGVFLKTSLIDNAEDLKGKLITVSGTNYRIVTVKYGDTVSALYVQSVNKS